MLLRLIENLLLPTRMKPEIKMKYNTAKVLPNRLLGIQIAMGLTGFVLIALIIQLGR